MRFEVEKYKYAAHRGLYDNKAGVPENSIEAFLNAVEAGYAIELDVQMSNDGFLVVFHDDTLNRMAGLKEEISSLDLHEIKKVRLLGTEFKIPTFEDVLMCVAGRVPLVIEVKSTPRYKELMPALIKELKKYNGDYIIESFDPRILKWLKKNEPEIIRGQLSDKNIREVKGKIKKVLLGKMFFNFITKPDFIAYQYLHIDSKFAKKHHKRKRAIFAWTVKSKEEYEKIKNNIDCVIFEKEETIK